MAEGSKCIKLSWRDTMPGMGPILDPLTEATSDFFVIYHCNALFSKDKIIIEMTKNYSL